MSRSSLKATVIMYDIESVVEDIRDKCKRYKIFEKELKKFNLTIDDVFIVYQMEDVHGNISWDNLQNGKDSRVKIIVEMMDGKLQAKCMHVASEPITLLDFDQAAEKKRSTGKSVQEYAKAMA
jgi:hypothetical protein